MGDGISLALGLDPDAGAGVEGMLGSAGVPITFKTGSGSRSPAGRVELEGEGGAGWGVGFMEGGPGSDSVSRPSPSIDKFKFKLVAGPGVLDFEPEVTGRDLVFLRFVEVIEDPSPGKSMIVRGWTQWARETRLL